MKLPLILPKRWAAIGSDCALQCVYVIAADMTRMSMISKGISCGIKQVFQDITSRIPLPFCVCWVFVWEGMAVEV